MVFKSFAVALSALVLAAAPAARASRDAIAQTVTFDELVVTARHAGAPIWEVETDAGSIIMIGAIGHIPRSAPWRPDSLEDAARRADRVLFPQEARLSAGDILRVIWRARTLTQLPQGSTSADYLEPDWQARFEAAAGRRLQPERNLLFSAHDLLREGLRFDREVTDSPGEVVRRAARRARVPYAPVGVIRGDDLIESLLGADPRAHAPCLKAAVVAVEAGTAQVAERGLAWTRADAAAVMNIPLQRALSACWPWGDPEYGPLLRDQWTTAVLEALDQPGVTLAVVQLGVLAEPDGVLDRLERRGLDIIGPDWRDEVPPQD